MNVLFFIALLLFSLLMQPVLAGGSTVDTSIFDTIIATYGGTINVLIVAVAILSAVSIAIALFDYIQK